MKRVVFAAVLIVVLLSFNTFCLFTIGKIKNEATIKLEELYEHACFESPDKLTAKCEKFTEYWLSEHHTLCLIVRHDLLDQVTISVSRFVPLAKFGEKSELACEITECKILFEEILDSEIPYLRNIL